MMVVGGSGSDDVVDVSDGVLVFMRYGGDKGMCCGYKGDNDGHSMIVAVVMVVTWKL